MDVRPTSSNVKEYSKPCGKIRRKSMKRKEKHGLTSGLLFHPLDG